MRTKQGVKDLITGILIGEGLKLTALEENAVNRIIEALTEENNLIIPNVTHRFSVPEKMAEWLHNNYEEIALNNGWKTQYDCQVPFLELPKENKETMIELCDRFINGGYV